MGYKIRENIQTSENLFNPNLVFMGDIGEILDGYPERSKALETLVKDPIAAKNINDKFVKDGYMYLLKGAKKGQETGFYSREYADKNTIESLGLDPYQVAYAQSLCGNTPFISTTTDIYSAAAFARKEKIYVIKVPVSDVYTFFNFEQLLESEYMIPDFIAKDEIVRSFRYNKVDSIYRYLTEEVGLDICPADLGATDEQIASLDYKRLDLIMAFNGDENEDIDCVFDQLRDVTLKNAARGKTFFKK